MRHTLPFLALLAVAAVAADLPPVSKLPPRPELPDPLVMLNGDRVTGKEQWFTRRRPELKLALALQIGFLRMSGRLREAVRIVPPLLWKPLRARFNGAAPDLASLRAMYRRP